MEINPQWITLVSVLTAMIASIAGLFVNTRPSSRRMCCRSTARSGSTRCATLWPASIEVEDIRYKHPAVQAAAVVARPDQKWGETPCAFVELKPGREASQDDLMAWCRQHLAGYKTPRHVVFTELPKTSTGKIQKFKLREMAKAV